MDRRTFLARTATVGAGAAAGTAFASTGPWAAVARARTRGSVVDPSGTTLARTLEPTGRGPYRRLTEAPGWSIVVRDELAAATSGREDRREPLATLVHLTDVHVIDTQSPTRVEFTDRLEDPSPAATGFFSSAWRPQETLTGQVADAMARQLQGIGAGPVTGRAFDAAVSTGDATDNQQANELDWFLRLLDGGHPLSINSGDLERYEGVQDDDATSFDPAYYHPGGGDTPDRYRADLGYPDRHELLDGAIAAFTPVGLPCPWYSVYGNHDGLVQGNAMANPAFDAIATGPVKVVGLPDGLSPAALQTILAEGDVGRLLTAPGAPTRLVTPDHPQQSRIVELVDNRDGTLSLFGTIVDHAGPASPPDRVAGVLDLASLSRELAVNDVQVGVDGVGTEVDRNVELLLTAPFTRPGGDAEPDPPVEEPAPPVDAAVPPAETSPVDAAPAAPATPPADAAVTPARGPLPVTGPAAPIAIGAALLGGALRLRCRDTDGDADAPG